MLPLLYDLLLEETNASVTIWSPVWSDLTALWKKTLSRQKQFKNEKSSANFEISVNSETKLSLKLFRMIREIKLFI